MKTVSHVPRGTERVVSLGDKTFVLVLGGPYTDRAIVAWEETSSGRVEAGYLFWEEANPPGWDGRPPMISSVRVEKRYRRGGLATAMLAFAREAEPDLQHSHALSEDGKAWSQVVGSNAASADVVFDHQIQGPSGGVTWHRIFAMSEGRRVGLLKWSEGGSRKPQIDQVWVHEGLRRQGIASRMLARAREVTPDLTHGVQLSPDGAAWSQAVGSKTAGPGGGVVPHRFRYKGPQWNLQQARPVVVAPQAMQDINNDITPRERIKVWEAIAAIEEGRARLEPKKRGPLVGTYGLRIDEDCRLLVYPNVDGKWHVFWVGQHTYGEAERRMASLEMESRSGGDDRGNSYARRARKVWLLNHFGTGYAVKCHYCPRILDYNTVEADRVIPGEQGGRYVRGNIVPACRQCNLARGHNMDWELDWDDMWEEYGLERAAAFQSVQRHPELDRFLPDGFECWVSYNVSDLYGGSSRKTHRWYIEAHADGEWWGHIEAGYTDGGYSSQGYPADAAVINDVWVHPKQQRKGVATGMLKALRAFAGQPVVHNQELSGDGRGWSRAVGLKTASKEVTLPEGYTAAVTPLAYGIASVVFSFHGTPIGAVQFWRSSQGWHGAPEIESDHRRKGLASAAYRWFEDTTGESLIPSRTQTEDGREFWRSRTAVRQAAARVDLSTLKFDPSWGDAVDRYQYNYRARVTLPDGRQVASMEVSWFQHPSYAPDREAKVEMIEVDEEYRRQGIAAWLYQKMIDHIRSQQPGWDLKDLQHSYMTDDGSALWRSVGPRLSSVEGLVVREVPESRSPDFRTVKAYIGSEEIGYLRWVRSDAPDDQYDTNGTVSYVAVEPAHQRQGVATAMWEEAKRLDPGLRHSRVQTNEGMGWAKTVAKTADLWNDLHTDYPLRGSTRNKVYRAIVFDDIDTSLSAAQRAKIVQQRLEGRQASNRWSHWTWDEEWAEHFATELAALNYDERGVRREGLTRVVVEAYLDRSDVEWDPAVLERLRNGFDLPEPEVILRPGSRVYVEAIRIHDHSYSWETFPVRRKVVASSIPLRITTEPGSKYKGDDDSRAVVAYHSQTGEMIGWLRFDRTMQSVDEVWVDPRHRRQGVAKALADRLLRTIPRDEREGWTRTPTTPDGRGFLNGYGVDVPMGSEHQHEMIDPYTAATV